MIRAAPARLGTLGGVVLRVRDDERLRGQRKLLALVAFLARRGSDGAGREELAALLWGDRDEQRARHSLRTALTALRRELGDAVEADGARVRLTPGAVTLDVAELEADAAAGRAREAAARWDGDFLAGFDDVGGDEFRSWLDAEREALRRRLSDLLAGLVAEERARGRWGEGVRWARQWCALRPTDERAHRELVELLALAGRDAEARAEHARALAQWRADGLEPSAESVALGERLDARQGERAGSRTSGAGVIRPQGAGSAALLSPELVGRGDAFALLRRAAADAAATDGAGAGAAVLVEGEDGLGKTRLVDELLRALTADRPAPLVLSGCAFEAESALPWAAARAVLARLGDAEGLAGAAPDDLALAGVAAPVIRERLPRLPAPPADHEPVAVGHALARVLAVVAEEQPVVLVLDDVHHADAASRAALCAVARRPPAGVLVLLACRAGRECGALVAELGDVPRLQRLPLAPLDVGEVEAMLASTVDLPPADRGALAQRLHGDASGNPFFILALLSALADEGVLALDGAGRWRLREEPGATLPLPATVQEAVEGRLLLLPPRARAVAEAAALLTPPIAPEALRRVSGCSEAELLEATDELLARRILRPRELRTGGATGYQFAHELVRRAVVERLDPTRRQALERARGVAEAPAGATAPSTGRPARRASRRLLAMAAALLVVLVGAAAMLVRPPGSAPGGAAAAGPGGAAAADRIAVLPFVVQGSAQYDYLAEGLADLLHGTLDGAGSLRSVDLSPALARAEASADRALSDANAPALARRFDVGLYVLGSVIEAGGQLRLGAALHRADGARLALVEAGPAPEARLFELVDELARRLLAARGSSDGARLSQLAATTTHSLPALKAWLRGEQAFRRADYATAFDAFAEAGTLDSAFALAHYRAAVAAEWAGRADLLHPAAARAVRHAGRLSQRDQLLLHAYDAYTRGDATGAESRYRSLLTEYPDDVDAWWGLGEVLFHLAPSTGRSVLLAREPFERVLALDPTHEDAVLHLARLAAVERRPRVVDSLVAGLPGITRPGSVIAPSIRAVQAFASGTAAARDSVVAELRVSDPIVTVVAVAHVALYTGDLAGAARIATTLTDATRPRPVRALGWSYLAQLETARGRWQAARQALARLAATHAALAEAQHAELSQLPWVRDAGAPPWTGAATQRALPEDSLVGYVLREPALYDAIAAHHRRMRALRGAAASADASVSLEPPLAAAARPLPEERALLAHLAVARRAAQLRGADPDGAIAQLQQARHDTWFVYAIASPFFARSAERFLHAELLADRGRDADALAAFGAFAHYSLYDLPYLVPAMLRRAELLERRGMPEAAAAERTRARELWGEADVEARRYLR